MDGFVLRLFVFAALLGDLSRLVSPASAGHIAHSHFGRNLNHQLTCRRGDETSRADNFFFAGIVSHSSSIRRLQVLGFVGAGLAPPGVRVIRDSAVNRPA